VSPGVRRRWAGSEVMSVVLRFCPGGIVPTRGRGAPCRAPRDSSEPGQDRQAGRETTALQAPWTIGQPTRPPGRPLALANDRMKLSGLGRRLSKGSTTISRALLACTI
jgi:hypothetical protein